MLQSGENGRSIESYSAVNFAKFCFRSALSKGERREYIDAVLCLMDSPPLTSTSEFPGVRNRFDDFVATHINQTLSIHGTVRSKDMTSLGRPKI